MAHRKTRTHSKISHLPWDVKATVERLLYEGRATYAEIADFIAGEGHEISKSAVGRYAKSLATNLADIRLAQENLRIIAEEIAQYPGIDTTEGIVRILSHRVLGAVQNLDEDKLKDVDPLKLMGEATGLVRAAAYKARIDIQNRDALEAGVKKVQDDLFALMAQENPDAYRALTETVSRYEADRRETEVSP